MYLTMILVSVQGGRNSVAEFEDITGSPIALCRLTCRRFLWITLYIEVEVASSAFFMNGGVII